MGRGVASHGLIHTWHLMSPFTQDVVADLQGRPPPLLWVEPTFLGWTLPVLCVLCERPSKTCPAFLNYWRHWDDLEGTAVSIRCSNVCWSVFWSFLVQRLVSGFWGSLLSQKACCVYLDVKRHLSTSSVNVYVVSLDTTLSTQHLRLRFSQIYTQQTGFVCQLKRKRKTTLHFAFAEYLQKASIYFAAVPLNWRRTTRGGLTELQAAINSAFAADSSFLDFD